MLLKDFLSDISVIKYNFKIYIPKLWLTGKFKKLIPLGLRNKININKYACIKIINIANYNGK